MMKQLYWVRGIPVRWFSLGALAACFCLDAQTLDALARAYRDSPSPARRGSILRYAAAHGKDQSGALAHFALGMATFEDKDYPTAIENLKKAQPRLPKLNDYIAYYLGAARAETGDFSSVTREISPLRATTTPSPLAARGTLLEARALTESGTPDEAIRLLRQRYADLPQPDADLALAFGYAAAREPARAAEYYQRVYYGYPESEAATRAGAALVTLRETMGASYPPPPARQMLERANRLLELHDYHRARSEFEALAPQLPGLERDQARVRMGAADFLRNDVSAAYHYLKSLNVAESEADAERLHYLAECARKLQDDDEMIGLVSRLGKVYPQSPWRFKALISAGNRFLLSNQPDKYESLYRACYQSFPAEPLASYCHWKVAWNAYLRRARDTAELLREQIERYPSSIQTGAAIYFLGRMAESRKEFAAARACYTKIAELYPNFYYAGLARERLAQPSLVTAGPSEPMAQFFNRIAFPRRARPESLQANPITKLRLERARLLKSAGFPDWAEAELRFGARTDGQPHVLAMELARSADSPYQALRYMKGLARDYLAMDFEDAPVQFWELLFPMPYRSQLERHAKQQGLDPFLLAALIRQESEFNPKAVSRAHAYGLTQVMPSTGRQLARRSGIRRFNNGMLFQPDTNLRLGTSHLRSLLDQWGGKWELTLASYNAGKTRVNEWLTWASYEEPAEFIETIPFTETREYVQAVLRNAAIYRRLYENAVKPASAKPARARAGTTRRARLSP
jgi:soluble lytic murein transglycosylase